MTRSELFSHLAHRITLSLILGNRLMEDAISAVILSFCIIIFCWVLIVLIEKDRGLATLFKLLFDFLHSLV